MERKPKTSRPSFFKVLIKDDYTTRLRLPHVFVRKYGKYLTENAKLRNSTSGDTWNLKVDEETYDDEKYLCFVGGGWTKFVKDLELKLGEFLVFWFNLGNSITFDVSVFGTNCCEREISAKAVDSDADDEDFDLSNDCHNNVPDVTKKRSRICIPKSEGAGTDSEAQSGNSGEETYPRFQVVLTENRKSRWCLPKKFVEAAGLTGKRAVVLKYPPKQRNWAVILDPSSRPNPSLDMSVGWNDFRKENKLVLGRTYSFVFDPIRNVIEVKEHNMM